MVLPETLDGWIYYRDRMFLLKQQMKTCLEEQNRLKNIIKRRKKAGARLHDRTGRLSISLGEAKKMLVVEEKLHRSTKREWLQMTNVLGTPKIKMKRREFYIGNNLKKPVPMWIK